MAEARIHSARKIGMTTKLAYGFGSIAYGIKDNGFQTLLLLYYNQVIGLRADLVGLAILIALVIDAFVDPIIGHLSDHTRNRWGRRHPFMYAAALPVGILYLLLWNPPTGSTAATLGYLVLVSILVRTAISCYEVPSSALAPELTTDYHERTSVLGYRYLFGWIGGMTMSLITFIVFLAPTARYPVGQLNPHGYKIYAVVAATAMTLAILISAWGTHREIRHLPKVTPTATSIGETFHGIMSTLRNKAFLMLLISGIFSFTAQGLTFALSTYLNTYFWAFKANVLGLFTIVVLVGVALAFVIASAASRTLGKRETGVLVGVLYPLVAISPFVLRYAGLFPANGSPALLPILMTITAIGTAFGVAGAIIGASMMSDVVEDAQLRSGERSEGLFFAGSFFMQKCVSGLGLFLSGAILTAVHFPVGATPGTVTPDILRNLVLIYAAALIALSLLAAFFVRKFPLGGRQEHDARVAQLAETASHTSPLPGSEPELRSPYPAE
jgi:GPH family glycoside/pentoside/hexuronide:cation symporter